MCRLPHDRRQGRRLRTRTHRYRDPPQRGPPAADHPAPPTLLPEGFLYVSAVTESGAAIRGIRVNEDSFNIQIKDARGQFHSFAKSDLKELKPLPNETPMPSYEGSLSPAELDDLVAYLASLKGKS
jgi:hypothetical protein